jgi:uncharacterized protein
MSCLRNGWRCCSSRERASGRRLEAQGQKGDNQGVRLTEEMKRVVLEQRLGFAATVSADKTPNLSPKGTTTVFDDEHLAFADIHSPQTVRNLTENPAIEVNVVDPIVRKGFRFKGQAQIHSDGEIYERALRLLAKRGYEVPPARVNAIVVIAVESAAPLISPAYDSGASEQEVAAQWEARIAQLRSREGGTGAPSAP